MIKVKKAWRDPEGSRRLRLPDFDVQGPAEIPDDLATQL
jgi:hypothetical protein